MDINITFKSTLDKIKDIAKRNAAFDKLDKQSKRLEIAWDALQLVRRGKIAASNGNYWTGGLDQIWYRSHSPTELQEELLTSVSKSCQVCARGLVMVSQIRLGNKISPNDGELDCGSEENLNGFTMVAMNEMEREYENSEYLHPYDSNTEEKLANIMCNVLVNGNFNKHDKADYLTSPLLGD